jgi:hypothetical protein
MILAFISDPECVGSFMSRRCVEASQLLGGFDTDRTQVLFGRFLRKLLPQTNQQFNGVAKAQKTTTKKREQIKNEKNEKEKEAKNGTIGQRIVPGLWGSPTSMSLLGFALRCRGRLPRSAAAEVA